MEQIMSSKSPVRSCEDVDETALSYAEIKALCAGNPLIAEKMNLDIEVAKLRMLKADYQSQHYRLEDDLLKRFPEQIASVAERISGIEKDIEAYAVESAKTMVTQESTTGAAAVSILFPGMTVNGVAYAEKEPAAKALLGACKSVTDRTDKNVGEYMGFKMSLRFDSFTKLVLLHLRGNMTYQVDLGTDAFGNITRINNALHDLPKKLDGAKSQLESLLSQQEAAKEELKNPFTLTNELAEKEARLALLNADLNIDGNGGFDVDNDTENRSGNADGLESDDSGEYADEYDDDYGQQSSSAKSVRPTMMDKLNAYNMEKLPTVPGKRTEQAI
jgi:GR25 family glycosyltransferase involved in LPS biosynthesis